MGGARNFFQTGLLVRGALRAYLTPKAVLFFFRKHAAVGGVPIFSAARLFGRGALYIPHPRKSAKEGALSYRLSSSLCNAAHRPVVQVAGCGWHVSGCLERKALLSGSAF